MCSMPPPQQSSIEETCPNGYSSVQKATWIFSFPTVHDACLWFPSHPAFNCYQLPCFREYLRHYSVPWAFTLPYHTAAATCLILDTARLFPLPSANFLLMALGLLAVHLVMVPTYAIWSHVVLCYSISALGATLNHLLLDQGWLGPLPLC